MPRKPKLLWPDSATILERSRGVIFAQWEELLRLRCNVIKTSDPDDIHDLRVASRRFRAVLNLFGPVVPNAPITKLNKQSRRLTSSLGGLRNIDEALLFFQSRTRTGNSADSRICTTLSELRPREMARIKTALRAFDTDKIDRMVRKMIAALDGDCIADLYSISFPAYFSDASIRRYQPIHQLLPVSTAPEQRESRHELRIAIKKLRYFFEIIAQVLERDYTNYLGQLKEYQSLLGRMNDVAEFEALIGKFKLPPEEREYAEATLQAEDTLLLENFTELIEQKPLSYTFLI